MSPRSKTERLDLLRKFLSENGYNVTTDPESILEDFKDGETEVVLLSAARHARLRKTESDLETARKDMNDLKNELAHSGKLSTIGLLSAEMAHEINNPLATIKMCTSEILENIGERNANPNYLKEMVSIVSRNTDNIAETVKSVLLLAKKGDDSYSKLDINVVLQETLKMVKPHFKRTEIDSISEFSSQPLEFFGNRNKLLQIFTNILLNAKDALMLTKEQKKYIKIETAPEGDQWISVRIKDNGIGMSDDVKNQLFNPFFTTKETGVGLGLAVVKRIVDEHKGTIDIETKKGGGSTFYISFPKDRRKVARS